MYIPHVPGMHAHFKVVVGDDKEKNIQGGIFLCSCLHLALNIKITMTVTTYEFL